MNHFRYSDSESDYFFLFNTFSANLWSTLHQASLQTVRHLWVYLNSVPFEYYLFLPDLGPLHHQSEFLDFMNKFSSQDICFINSLAY